MSSSRFPGKVLEDLSGLPMIVFMVQRARLARSLDDVVVVTSTDRSDDRLAAVLSEFNIATFRGDLNDVLARYKHAADRFGATEIVRLTGDCPLIDPAVVDSVVNARRAAGVDYSSNIDPPTFPDGFDVECFSSETLSEAFTRASTPPEREHVTLWMRSADSGVTRHNVSAIADFSHLRLTVDYPDDLAVVRSIVAGQAIDGRSMDLFDVLRALAQDPELSRSNVHVRNEGLRKSFAVNDSSS